MHAAVTTILSPIQDTCRRRQGIQVDTIWCKRGFSPSMLPMLTYLTLYIIITRDPLLDRFTLSVVSLRTQAYIRDPVSLKRHSDTVSQHD